MFSQDLWVCGFIFNFLNRPTTIHFWWIFYRVLKVELYLIFADSEYQLSSVDIYQCSSCSQKWSSEDEGYLSILLHVQHDKVYRKDKMLHLHENVLYYSLRIHYRAIRQL